jgi:hypothetical protein
MRSSSKKDGYSLSRQWFEFVIENSEMVRPIHGALYFWIVELNNRLNWKEVFGLPTDYSMQAIGIKGYQHYKNALNDLIKWGFINLHAKSHNQHSCNQISINLLCTLGLKQSIRQGLKQGSTQGRHSKTEKTIPNIVNPKKGSQREFLRLIISEFTEAYQKINKIPYAIVDEQREFSAADRFAEMYHIESFNDDDLIEEMKLYFRACCSINDNWLKSRMSLSFLTEKFNVINNTLKKDSKKAYTAQDVLEIKDYLKI